MNGSDNSKPELDRHQVTRRPAHIEKPEESISVMVVDDDPKVRGAISKYLAKTGYEIRAFDDAPKCLSSFQERPADIVILDLCMPSMDGMTVLRQIKKIAPSTEVIIVTGHADKNAAIDALRLGAFNLFEKPISLVELTETLKRTVRYQTALRDGERLAEQLTLMSRREAKRWGIEGFVGRSKGIRSVLKNIRLLQKSDRTAVLITGESGTGKELVARAIHFGGTRSSRPFVPVNCSAIPNSLAESILFGHMRGAFTGATADKKGCFELADKGSLFMDEIGDMALDVQTKLLRVLEDGIIVPVGATRGCKVDVRILASTNAKLEERVASGAFREDLYYRLARYRIAVPPLRARRGDIALLANHFIELLSQEMGMPLPRASAEFMDALQAYDLPGNVRELRNIIERALITSSGPELDVKDLHLHGLLAAPWPAPAPKTGLETENEALPLNLQESQDILVRRALARAGGNISEAARLLGVNRNKLYRMLK